MKPTDSELSVLSVLWKDGPSTVRHVNEKLNTERRVGYTNTLKIMQIMHDKGLLDRDESSRSHVYAPAVGPMDVKRDILSHMIDSVFDGKTSDLLVHALGNYQPSTEELAQIRALINKLEENE